jgi:hypothetical protein
MDNMLKSWLFKFKMVKFLQALVMFMHTCNVNVVSIRYEASSQNT